MMKYLIVILFYLFFVSVSNAQTVDKGLPYIVSNKITPTKKFISVSNENNAQEIQQILREESTSKNKMYRFGLEKEIDIPFFENAEKIELESGYSVYQLGFESKTAVSLSFIFNEFTLDQHSFLYIVDPKTNSYIGAYSSLNNNKGNALGTELVMSERVILELHYNSTEPIQSKLKIGTVVHGFRDITKVAKGLNNSGSCEVDINCPLGKGWENQRNSVAMMVNGGGFCTGTLVNNTSGNELPYFLSARHCGTNPTTWVFRFRYEAPEGQTDCGTTNPSGDGPTTMSINGATLCANYDASDFTLSLLNFTPDPNWGIYYSGWDRRNIAPTTCTGIHHPSGDVKKISQDSNTALSSSFSNILPDSHWKVPSWDFGATEPGSSGSPLFNQDHRVVGQLQGGNSHCGGPSSEMNDDYGKFAMSWEGGGTNDSRLSNWLDPNNIAPLYIDGFDPLTPTLNYDASISANDMQLSTVCGESLAPKITILNTGIDTLFNVQIHYGFDGDYSNSYSWNDTLITYQTTEISLNDTILSDGSHKFNAYLELGLISDENNSNDTTIFEFKINKNASAIFLNLSIPCYASENSWTLSLNNEVINNGGPYSDALSVPIIDSFCLDQQCYNFTLYDTFGDGITSTGCNNGSFTITKRDGTILASLDTTKANFGKSIIENFCVTIDENQIKADFILYPNPANNMFSIASKNYPILNYIIYNSLGQKIQSETVNAKIKDIQTSQLSNGLYFIEIKTTNEKIVREVLINHSN